MTGRDPMRGWVDSFPEMLEAAWAAPIPDGFGPSHRRFLVFGGMGGSGMAGALAAVHLAAKGIPAYAWRDAGLPGWVSPDDALVLLSYSGETWEAAAMLEEALARGVSVRVVASGGSLAKRAGAAGAPLFRPPEGLAPRAALPWLLAGAYRAAGGLGHGEVEAAADLLRAERASPPPERDPVAIAERIGERIACLVPVGAAMEVVAYRWRNQILENAERFAIVSPLPEMAHNEIMGWRHLGDAGLAGPFLVLVDHWPLEDPLAGVLTALEREARRVGVAFHVLPPPSTAGFAGLLAQVQLGDRISVDLAERIGVPSTPVEAIRRLKELAGKEPRP